MKFARIGFYTVVILLLLALPGSALAQTYLFSLDQLTVHYYINSNGTADIDYTFVFTNSRSASPIDYVDVGTPNASYKISGIVADVDGIPITDISSSGYQGSGTGVALGLGKNAIRAGQSGTVHAFIPGLEGILFADDQDNAYASAVFIPTWFGSQYVEGFTNMSITFHLPPGVKPDEPRWHEAPEGFTETPLTNFDPQGRITYTWKNMQGRAYKQYKFGASFPLDYVPAESVRRASVLDRLNIDLGALTFYGFLLCFGGAWVGSFAAGIYNSSRRKLQYLPPKAAIEGHGIKRGLTAVEAAILLEQPMDKVLTMILFSIIKKGAASVISRDPLELNKTINSTVELRPYEIDFLKAFEFSDKRKRRLALQEMMVALVKEVSNKMKGFSRRETLAYYRDIIQRAWNQVEAADTPEVKSEKFDEVMEWTMLDRNYEDRTRDVFRGGPVIVPRWWGRYDPTWRPAATISSPVSTSTAAPSGGHPSLPTLPGAAFAASMVNGVQNFSAGVIGNLNEFTSGITRKTNPAPVSTYRSGGSRSGGGCACACACAGCACACAGGGR